MGKLLKLIGIVLGIGVLCAILGVVVLVTFVSPNRFKPMIIEQVMKATGRQLTIEGDLSWSFFPSIGVSVGRATLGNPAHFQQKTFAEISQVKLNVRVLPLLRGRVVSSGIVLTGLHLYLIKNAQGDMNWVFVPKASPVPSEPSQASSRSLKKASMGLAIAGIDITDGKVTWIDEQAKQSYDVNHFVLRVNKVNLVEPFPIVSSFDFSSNNPAITGHVAVTANAALSLDKQIYSFRNMNLIADMRQNGKKVQVKLVGNLIADLVQQTVQWTDLKADMANVSLVGKINMTNLNNNPLIAGQLQIKPFDLKKTLQQLKQDNPDIQVANNVKGQLSFLASAQSFTAQGKVIIADLQAAKVKVSNLTLPIQLQNGVLSLAPITASVYQGSLDGQAKIKLNAAVPEISTQTKLTHIQLAPLFQDIDGQQKMKIAGTGNVEFQVTTKGADAKTIVKNLNGTGQLNVTQGAVEGIDIGYLIDTATSLLSKKSVSSNNTNKTDFRSLTATVTINDGVINNQDLLLDAVRFDTKGKGSIDLVNQKINYSLDSQVKQLAADKKDDVNNLYGIAIPMHIAGSLNDPSIGLNVNAVLEAIAKLQLQRATERAQNKLQDRIKKQIPGDAGKLLEGILGN